jgi:hypothetical protein
MYRSEHPFSSFNQVSSFDSGILFETEIGTLNLAGIISDIGLIAPRAKHNGAPTSSRAAPHAKAGFVKRGNSSIAIINT